MRSSLPTPSTPTASSSRSSSPSPPKWPGHAGRSTRCVPSGVLPDSVACTVFEGPDEYLYGEESALLETIDGRGPFPRVVPTYRVGLLGIDAARRDPHGPALVNNVETMANVARIIAYGPQWFRRVGTPESPGTVVATVSWRRTPRGRGRVPNGHAVARHHRIDRRRSSARRDGQGRAQRGREPRDSRRPTRRARQSRGDEGRLVAASGRRASSCSTSPTDMVAVAAGVARFLAIESCGQCTPCKLDGITLAELLERLARNDANRFDMDEIEKRVGTVDFGARCFLAVQQNTMLASLLTRFRHEFEAHLTHRAAAVEPVLIAELVDIRDGVATIDERHRHKELDWSYGPRWSGSTPSELKRRYTTRRADGSTKWEAPTPQAALTFASPDVTPGRADSSLA